MSGRHFKVLCLLQKNMLAIFLYSSTSSKMVLWLSRRNVWKDKVLMQEGKDSACSGDLFDTLAISSILKILITGTVMINVSICKVTMLERNFEIILNNITYVGYEDVLFSATFYQDILREH